MITRTHEKISVRNQCALLEVPRSVIYYAPTPKPDDSILMNEIHDLWLRRPFYGYRRIAQVLKRGGHNVNYKRILRLMRLMNLQALYPKKRLTVPGKGHIIYPYLLRNLAITRPDQVWASDITYIRLAQGFVYLVCLIDVYSRHIVAWEISNSLSEDFCLTMLSCALLKGNPQIVNTDQGSQFTSNAWIATLKHCGIQISMDGAGRCMDNIYIERFWRTLKYEDVNLMFYETVPEVYNGIRKFIDFYNNERPHSALGYRTPSEIYNHKLVVDKIEKLTEELSLNCASMAPSF